MYLLNDTKHILWDRLLENFVDDDNKMNEKVDIFKKRKYEQVVSECNKLRTFFKKMAKRNITFLSEKNMIMSGLNTEKLLMLLKFQTAMIQKLMF